MVHHIRKEQLDVGEEKIIAVDWRADLIVAEESSKTAKSITAVFPHKCRQVIKCCKHVWEVYLDLPLTDGILPLQMSASHPSQYSSTNRSHAIN